MGADLQTTRPGTIVRDLLDAGLEFGAVLDVGIRAETPFLRKALPNHKHYLFEPMAEWHETIHENYRGVDYELIPAACSNHDGTAEFVAMSKDGRLDLPSHGQLSEHKPNSAGSITTVDTIRLDTFAEERSLDGPLLLKVDVDGADPLVIEGAAAVLELCHLVILEMSRKNFLRLASLMHEAGFVIHSISGLRYGQLGEAAQSSGLLWCDVSFLPSHLAFDERFRPHRSAPGHAR